MLENANYSAISQIPIGTRALTIHSEGAGVGTVFTFAFPPALVLGPPPILGPVCVPGEVFGAAQALEQNR